MATCNFAQLGLVVAEHEVNTTFGGVLDQGELLAHAAEDYVLRGDAKALNQLQLILGIKNKDDQSKISFSVCADGRVQATERYQCLIFNTTCTGHTCEKKTRG